MNIHWYPGHMAKTKRLLQENLSLVDIVIELLDARIPLSSKNPDIDQLALNKHRIVVLNKSDLSDQTINKKWEEYFIKQNFKVVLADSTKGKGLQEISKASIEFMEEKIQRYKSRGRLLTPTRAMIVGIPNVGKSTIINKYANKNVVEAADKPGVTRTKKWVKIKSDFELLDTPGILWPKISEELIAVKLAITGAVKDAIVDQYTLSLRLIGLLRKIKPEALTQRYKIEILDSETDVDIHNKIGTARGFLVKGGEIDRERTAVILLDEFRSGKIGRISLEEPEDNVLS